MVRYFFISFIQRKTPPESADNHFVRYISLHLSPEVFRPRALSCCMNSRPYIPCVPFILLSDVCSQLLLPSQGTKAPTHIWRPIGQSPPDWPPTGNFESIQTAPPIASQKIPRPDPSSENPASRFNGHRTSVQLPLRSSTIVLGTGLYKWYLGMLHAQRH